MLDSLSSTFETSVSDVDRPPPASRGVTEQVRSLEKLDLEGLRASWRSRYGDPPALRSPELLRLLLAWRIQARAWGGLDGATRLKLRHRAVAGAEVPVGSKVSREWRGVRQDVEVTDQGCLWNGKTYASLSAVARAITGTRWNGPRFFGLREKA